MYLHKIIIFQINNQSQIATPQEAEIKIPAVGATPVAVSTQLPAAVAQLSQQGEMSHIDSLSINCRQESLVNLHCV